MAFSNSRGYSIPCITAAGVAFTRGYSIPCIAAAGVALTQLTVCLKLCSLMY